ncbi:signal peptide peptidase-domain-containing protein [Dunaliella salina]|uniref:Signal peptide peptidase-domain-containing protein n=1 Tax=Dunaliella salina TaxID=3046 RepID=A0ABQ7H192_DUNSA|nr:signal peptide peptidase-domain-containing protein [Dunaliella salina]|eukprot:KAF5840585.1 signal peptide peptidase-domain-containing protein [Dunaliella salina]
MQFALAWSLAFFCFLFPLCARGARDQCLFGTLVMLDIASSHKVHEEVYGTLAYPALDSALEKEYRGTIVKADPPEACSPLHELPADSIVLAARGTCSFKEKALAIQEAKGAAMVLYDNRPGCVSMGAEDDKNTTHNKNVMIPCMSISHADGLSLKASLKAKGALPAALAPTQPSFDPSCLLILSLAVATLVLGALWSGHDHCVEKASKRNGGEGAGHETSASQQTTGTMEITAHSAVLFVCVACAMMLCLFFFMDETFYILLVLFCLASVNALALSLEALLLHSHLLPKGAASHVTHMPLLGPGPTVYMACLPAAATMTLVWVFHRDSEYAWVLQDVQGVALMLLILRTLKLGSIKVACILLPLCFLYDIFWVFLSPYFFGGESVMVEVAHGGSMNEAPPMLLLIPALGKERQLGGYTMLGYGDIVLPGLLVAFLYRLDLDKHANLVQGYFLPSCFGYAGGLALCYAALFNSWFGDQVRHRKRCDDSSLEYRS